jgi:hypothetical protein
MAKTIRAHFGNPDIEVMAWVSILPPNSILCSLASKLNSGNLSCHDRLSFSTPHPFERSRACASDHSRFILRFVDTTSNVVVLAVLHSKRNVQHGWLRTVQSEDRTFGCLRPPSHCRELSILQD